jgi:hypothetical protein
MLVNLLILGGCIGAALVFGWWVHRHQRDIDAYQERRYREPAIFFPPDTAGWPSPE